MSAPSAATLALAESLARLSEAELLEAVRSMSDKQLRKLYGVVGVRDCRCPVVKLDCGCEGPCDCPSLIEPCQHAFTRPLFLWPVPIVAEILGRLEPRDYAEPPPAAERTIVLRRHALAEVRAERRGGGQSLWHEADLVHHQAVLNRVTREVRRRRNGTDQVGRLRAAAPPEAPGTAPEPPLPAGIAGVGLTTFREVHEARIRHAGNKLCTPAKPIVDEPPATA